VAKKKEPPRGRVEVRLKVRNYRPIEGDKRRRAVNIKDPTDIISRRQFVARAKREVVIIKPKEHLSIHEKRVKWYANHVNHEEFDRMVGAGEKSGDFISLDDAEGMKEFQMYENMIHSRDADIRAIGYDYFADLEDEYLNEDWGETAGAA
jgi:hypothetical protein